jgi:hypothetical protein
MTKAELKKAREINELLKKPSLTIDEIDRVYEEYHPAWDCETSSGGVFFSPPDLSHDSVLMGAHHGAVLDMAAGIGMMSYSAIVRNYYDEGLDSLTLIEYNPIFHEMSKRLLSPLSAHTHSGKIIEMNFILGSMWDEKLWTSIMTSREGQKFTVMLSNPPYGKQTKEEREEAAWMYYQGEREIAAQELCYRFAEEGTFILPAGSVDFTFSGAHRGYERRPSNKMKKLHDALGRHGVHLHQECTGVDCSIYIDQWKGTRVSTESVEVSFQTIDQFSDHSGLDRPSSELS